MTRPVTLIHLAIVTCLLCNTAGAQSTLSTNSGINSVDTWITVDITVQTNDTITLPSAVYNPITQTTSNIVPITSPSRTFHVELGYDSNLAIVANIWPKGNALNPDGTGGGTTSMLRYAGGQITAFDLNGNPIPFTVPNASFTANTPLSFLGSNPGATVTGGIVVGNLQNHANLLGASLAYGSGSTTATMTVPLPSGGSAIWNYTLSGSNWLAQQITVVPSGVSASTSSVTFQLANHSWSENIINDLARASTTNTLETLPPQLSGTTQSLPTPPSDSATVSTPSIVAPTNCNTNVYSLGGSQNIVLQHGIFSNSCAWTVMANWVNPDFLFGTEIIPSFSSTSPLASQGQDLINEIKAVGGKNYILIGHSQGGLISRSAAQYFQSEAPGTVKGVLTVDTPHLGANSAVNSAAFVAGVMGYEGVNYLENEGCFYDPYQMPCYFGDLMLLGSATVVAEVLGNNLGSWSDLMPGSAFLNSLNNPATPENFEQAAIIGNTPQRFAFSRILTNAAAGLACPAPGAPCCLPQDNYCGERAIAQDMEEWYLFMFIAAFWDAVELSLDDYCGSDDPDYDPDCNQIEQIIINQIQTFATLMKIMDDVDFVWNGVVDLPTDITSDGIVQLSSQYYPSPTAYQSVINGADSHTGALKSTYVHPAIDAALITEFHAPTQASCTFSLPSNQVTEPGSGGSGSFALTTSPGCLWNASSQAPWLTITANPNGESSGTISFTAAPNTSTIQLRGTIQVGNGTSSTLFKVIEQAACTYSLSESPFITSPAAGETITVQVTTQQNCVWSAVSNAAWLTITSGAAGTGSGSFTWQAAQNTGSTDRTGVINVMGEAITVIDGSSTGTPGMATVSISGESQTYTFNPCQGKSYSCPVTVPNAGTISITVAGQTFTYDYNTTTSNLLAQGLALVINSTAGSPVTATVPDNGTTIYLVSVNNGTSSNYPISTSFTFNTSYFSSPAFTATASGTNLTGGTN